MIDARTIFDAYLENELTEGQLRDLAAWMDESDDNVDRFVEACCLDSCLQDVLREKQMIQDGIETLDRGEASTWQAGGPIDDAAGSGDPLSPGLLTIDVHPIQVGRGFSDWSVAYLVASVILVVCLFVGTLVPVSSSSLTAMKESPTAAFHGAPTTDAVGRITGMVDCDWRKSVSGDGDVSAVRIGDAFDVGSGLMEITYDSGARVILQGPASYKIDSAAGGYLSRGKLTARVETGGARRGTRDEGVAGGQRPVASDDQSTSDIHRSSFSIHPSSSDPSPVARRLSPLFAVTTPTATITDLGTEFGVLVARDGATQVHVIEGMVETRIVGSKEDQGEHRRVTAGQAVAMQPSGNQIDTVAYGSQSFVRKLDVLPNSPGEMAYIEAVMLDDPMGYWPLNEPAKSRTFADRSGHGLMGYGMNKVASGQPGPFGQGSRATAFSGGDYIDVGQHNEFAMPNGFTVEAWVWIDDATESSYVFSSLGRTSGGFGCGWGLAVCGQTAAGEKLDAPMVQLIVQMQNHFDFPLPTDEPLEDGWLHVAVTFDDANTARFYLNGELRGTVAGKKPARVAPVWLQIGCAEPIESDFWRGRLAHVAVYPRVLSVEQIRDHFEKPMKE